MDVDTVLQRIRQLEFFRDQIVHIQHIPARPAVYADPPGGLHPAVARTLLWQGIDRLYSHQAEAIGHIRAGRNVVIVTGTASGKTLCYNIPVVEAIIADSRTTALYLYPTKALAQDQLRGLGPFEQTGGVQFLCGTYDGDTPGDLRRKLRDGANVLLTNPDMLNQGILPNHARWSRFFTHLKYIVIDEVHSYRGVFGSHLANVIRRLTRICQHYGSQPVFICCSATIGNPREHAERITGQPMQLVNRDGSPRGPRRFVLWNPPPLTVAARGAADHWRVGGDRRSSIAEATQLLTALVAEDVQTIAFVRTRLAAELIFKRARDLLRPISRRLAESVHAYRSGYLPEERREIERKLVQREILGIASTNALELGIDIGSLDACIMVGYPGTVASTWQQAGRAGRGLEESLTFLIAQNTPIDQYLMAHPDYLFAQSPEQAVVDPDNPHIVIGHIKCAAHELPLADDEVSHFGDYAPVLLELLEEEGAIKHLNGYWYWSSSEYPAAHLNLRSIGGAVYTIQDESDGERVIGTMDETSAFSQLHEHAVYLHGADTYFVEELDVEQKIAHVRRLDLDYYTQSVPASQIRVDATERESLWRGATLGLGEVTVTTVIPMFKKIRFEHRDSLGFEQLELPPQNLETVAMWLAPPEEIVREMMSRQMIVGEALIGVANALVDVAPLYVMCDVQDIGATVDARCLGRDALFVYDRYPGGIGYADRILGAIEDILRTARTVIEECACADGCPSCVGAPVPPPFTDDLDSTVRGRIPDKAAALFLLQRLVP